MASKVTEDQLKRAMPNNMRPLVDTQLVKKMNDIAKDPLLRDNFVDNLLGFASILKSGRFRITDYVNAVKYVGYKLAGDSNIQAYTKTFPKRYQRMLNKGMEEKHIHSVSSAYVRNQLVQAVFDQAMIPVHILNADLFQKALNVQAGLMLTAKSDFVKSNAANSILNTLKPPETQKIELEVGQKDDTIRELRTVMAELAAAQQRNIATGVSNAGEVAQSKLLLESTVVEGEVVE